MQVCFYLCVFAALQPQREEIRHKQTEPEGQHSLLVIQNFLEYPGTMALIAAHVLLAGSGLWLA